MYHAVLKALGFTLIGSRQYQLSYRVEGLSLLVDFQILLGTELLSYGSKSGPFRKRLLNLAPKTDSVFRVGVSSDHVFLLNPKPKART